MALPISATPTIKRKDAKRLQQKIFPYCSGNVITVDSETYGRIQVEMRKIFSRLDKKNSLSPVIAERIRQEAEKMFASLPPKVPPVIDPEKVRKAIEETRKMMEMTI